MQTRSANQSHGVTGPPTTLEYVLSEQNEESTEEQERTQAQDEEGEIGILHGGALPATLGIVGARPAKEALRTTRTSTRQGEDAAGMIAV